MAKKTPSVALPSVDYRLVPIRPEAHLFQVTCTVTDPDPAGQRFALPTWIPGSYMIREFAKNIVRIEASAGGKAVGLTQIDKATWQAEKVPAGTALSVTMEVYAWDLSVRGAHLDGSHGFFNGTSVFLCALGQEDRPCRVELVKPQGKAYAAWRVATSLPIAKGEKGAAALYGFGRYRAADYDELIDHPVEMGTFALVEFKARGVPHAIAVTGRTDVDLKRLAADLKPICEWQIDLFGGKAPMDRYVFLVMAVGDGYGGLEHRASTALLCSRDDLPNSNTPASGPLPEAYVTFLGLCSHEYFHTWNVKRIKPAAFVPYDLTQEAYTRLLWAFEGFTSYYDDLCLVKSGAIDSATYLNLLAKTASAVKKGPGRHLQSVAESSFTAWTKYYRQDENAPNAVVSYYAKGSLIALALDLKLRAESGGKANLDQVMQLLWQRHGRTGVGVAEEGPNSVFAAVAEVGGAAAARWLKQAVTGTGDLPLERLLKPFGVTLAWEAASSLPVLGAKTGGEGSEVKLTSVYNGGPAEAAGLAAGDVLIAWDGLKLTPAALDKRLKRHRAGDQVKLHAFRRDELIEASLTLAAPAADTAKLSLTAKADRAAQALRQGWIGA